MSRWTLEYHKGRKDTNPHSKKSFPCILKFCSLKVLGRLKSIKRMKVTLKIEFKL
jgi:hypothetical protein